MCLFLGSNYIFNDISPGKYELSIKQNNFCWESETQVVFVANETVQVSPFLQKGYFVVFSSSHNGRASYILPNGNMKTFDLIEGRTVHCIESPGIYTFSLESCHTYEKDEIIYNTDDAINEISIKTLRHKVTMYVTSVENIGNTYMSSKINNRVSIQGPLVYDNGKYVFDLYLSPTETAILIPQSDLLYFVPQTLHVNGSDDCVNLGSQFNAFKGKVFQGKIIPPLRGVKIIIKSENSSTIFTNETDEKGYYKFPPLNDFEVYHITATMDSYILVGPNENGDFVAHKLASIEVEVLDQIDNKKLQVDPAQI